MAEILIDARYFGRMLKNGRRANHMTRTDCAKMLKIPKDDLRCYERGTKIISESVLSRLVLYGLTLLKARNMPYKPQ